MLRLYGLRWGEHKGCRGPVNRIQNVNRALLAHLPVSIYPHQFHKESEAACALLDSRERPHVRDIRHSGVLPVPGYAPYRWGSSFRRTALLSLIFWNHPLRFGGGRSCKCPMQGVSLKAFRSNCLETKRHI